MTAQELTPGLGRRLLCLIYEALLLTAVVLTAGGIATGIAHAADLPQPRVLTRLVVIAVCAAYFAVQWCGRGQTLPMKTWRMRVQTVSGERMSVAQALLRMTAATTGYAAFGLSILWAVIDRDGQFLHDRLAGTRLVVAGPTSGERP